MEESKQGKKTIKLERAQGGCLGTKSRRRTWQAAKSHDKLQASVIVMDVRMGKPSGGNAPLPADEHIVREEGTR